MAQGDAAHKGRQRARNAGGNRSGTSGIHMFAEHMERREFADIEHLTEHVGDLQCLYQSGQIMANRALTATLVAQKEWAHELLDVALATQGRALYCRFYVVPLNAVMPQEEDEDAEEG
jgi:hypothetical protein